MLRRIEQILLRLPASGYRSFTRILRRKIRVNKKRVYRIMSENALIPRKKRKSDGKKKSGGGRRHPNLLRSAKIKNPGQALVGDITSYLVDGQKRHLATLKDHCSRRIVGRAASDRIDTELVLRALIDARRRRRSLRGCIHHTDRDSVYRFARYQATLKRFGMRCSMIERSVYENASAESFNKTVKYEEINLSDYASPAEADRAVFLFIRRYNHYRPHSSLNGMTPVEFEKLCRT